MRRYELLSKCLTKRPRDIYRVEYAEPDGWLREPTPAAAFTPSDLSQEGWGREIWITVLWLQHPWSCYCYLKHNKGQDRGTDLKRKEEINRGNPLEASRGLVALCGVEQEVLPGECVLVCSMHSQCFSRSQSRESQPAAVVTQQDNSPHSFVVSSWLKPWIRLWPRQPLAFSPLSLAPSASMTTLLTVTTDTRMERDNVTESRTTLMVTSITITTTNETSFNATKRALRWAWCWCPLGSSL
ncbi:hypothetical protein J4Q44_G00100890 [Coregonus suidteri]|uniref:Uncharacterized protein n=1 Tax=Coregonus suidteri TaxID=861788 RepID=A0AAN8LWT7_9TELE